MPRLLFSRLVCVGLISSCISVGCGEPRRVYVGGSILTMDANDRVASALATEGDRIGAVGDEVSVRAWAGASAEVIDLAGRAIVPGFIDAHGHFPGAGIDSLAADLNPPPIGNVGNMRDLVARLRERADAAASGDWVFGMGYDDTLLAEKRHPTRADLDRVSTTQPVVAMHISGHMGVANSEALAAIGIDRASVDPVGGRIVRDASGEPTGLLEESAVEALSARVLDPGIRDGIEIVRGASRFYVAAGVTTAQNGYAAKGHLTLLMWLSRLGVIPLRLVMWPGMEVVDEMLERGEGPPSSYDEEWVRFGAVKLVADGSIQGYTGYLSEPYHVPPSAGAHAGDASYRGYARIPRAELHERIRRYHEAGWQLAVHGNGDASIDDILDGFTAAFEAKPAQDARPIVIHAQMTRDDQLDRMKQLAVLPSFFSLHTYYWGDRHRDLFMGPARAARMSPAASALAKGVRFTIHCDTPVVPMEPLRLVWAAVNRRSASGATIGSAERITPMQALRAVTIDAAFQHFEEAIKGSLEVGKLADFVVLSASPLDHPETIDEIEVLETFVGGQSVYRAEGP